jgi:hypothetical protein
MPPTKDPKPAEARAAADQDIEQPAEIEAVQAETTDEAPVRELHGNADY